LHVRRVERLTYPEECRSKRFANVPHFATWLGIRSQHFEQRELGSIGLPFRL
jgi:hypothetical protein